MSARWQSRDDLVHEVVLVARQKVQRRAIARAVGVSRNTVKKILEAHAKQREEGHAALAAPPPRLPRASKLDPFKPRVPELFKEYPDITAQRIFEILRSEGFMGGYTAVKKYVREVRPKPPRKPSLETPNWGPGKMAESDWTPCDVIYATGEKQKLPISGSRAGHSIPSTDVTPLGQKGRSSYVSLVHENGSAVTSPAIQVPWSVTFDMPTRAPPRR